MLTLQRASAGSGKTYTLAKIYIRLLIANKDENNKWHLKSPREIKETISSILAITFTNKATSEMKQRIIDKLVALAEAKNLDLLTEDFINKTDYLAEFASEFNVSPQKVGMAASEALSALLNNYSDFAIKTIDSFFQDILRTFSYEANLNDSYQIEIDRAYVSSLAIDSTLDDFDKKKSHSPVEAEWLRIIMLDTMAQGSGWNIFNRKDSKSTVYGKIKEDLNKLEQEDYKEIRHEMERYFDKEGNDSAFLTAYLQFKERAYDERQYALTILKNATTHLIDVLSINGVDPDDCNASLKKHISKILAIDIDDKVSDKDPFTTANILTKGNIFTQKSKVAKPLQDIINATALDMYQKAHNWKDLSLFPVWSLWLTMGSLLPLLGLMNAVRIRLGDVLLADNIIRLDDTISILKQIVGNESDTSFIYERLGNRIEHYLIDEFQDTSKMQWDILYPLILESEAKNFDNLIIGDAKQSIYRFRNADPTLITEQVPSTFPKATKKGTDIADNTNWRSTRRIVEFNNFFFKHLSEQINTLVSSFSNRIDFIDLYSNVIQKPSHSKDAGYIEIHLAPKEKKEEIENPLSQIAPTISDILSRGYRMKDIAILVETNNQAKEIIDYLIQYNVTHSIASQRLEFISEDSLYISSSEAVRLVMVVLERIAFSLPLRDENNTKGKKGSRDIVHHNKLISREIKDNFTIFSLQHPEMSITEKLDRFLENFNTENTLWSLLDNMQSTAMPALIEAIIDSFLPESLKLKDTVFLSAFQDIVLDFCDKFTSDPASFAEWWRKRGNTKSIALPEDTDAIRVMTIHKSKGLEFKCVIIPFANFNFSPTSNSVEWRWLKVPSYISDLSFPPYLPVQTIPPLLHTDYAPVYEKYYSQIVMDAINNAYVAFTRAIDELYIFTKDSDARYMGSYIKKILLAPIEDGQLQLSAKEKGFILQEKLININENRDLITIGEKGENKTKKEAEDNKAHHQILNAYKTNGNRDILHYIESENNDNSILLSLDDESDPQSEGSLLHEVMRLIKSADDLDKALLSVRMKGLISLHQSTEWREMLGNALKNPLAIEWFDGTWKVINERDIFSHNEHTLRPDRIMVKEQSREAVIIDYKFGDVEADNSYISQIKKYMDSFKKVSGYHNIKGYLWYVRKNRILPIME